MAIKKNTSKKTTSGTTNKNTKEQLKTKINAPSSNKKIEMPKDKTTIKAKGSVKINTKKSSTNTKKNTIECVI